MTEAAPYNISIGSSLIVPNLKQIHPVKVPKIGFESVLLRGKFQVLAKRLINYA